MNILAHLGIFALIITFLPPFQTALILYEDYLIHYNRLWWQHILMILLSLVTYIAWSSLTVFLLFYYGDKLEK